MQEAENKRFLRRTCGVTQPSPYSSSLLLVTPPGMHLPRGELQPQPSISAHAAPQLSPALHRSKRKSKCGEVRLEGAMQDCEAQGA